MKKILGRAIACCAFLCMIGAHADNTGTSGLITGSDASGDFQIIIDPLSGTISVIYNTGNANDGTNTGTIQPGITTGTEFQQALSRMYANGLTMYNNETNYRPDDYLTREEVAKIIGQMYAVLGYVQTEKNTSCAFADIDETDPTLTSYVINSCRRGLFKGAHGKFMPRNTITRPEAMAVLIRMFEGKLSNENREPRWGDYYLKARALGLTTLNNPNAFNKEITRREIAIYILRLKNIILDPVLKAQALNQISSISGYNNTGINTEIVEYFESLANSITVSSDPELQEAIRRMNDNGLTNFKTIAEYKPFEVLNREQASKILYLFGTVFGFVNIVGPVPPECIFKDISTADATLVTYIEKSCQANILRGNDGYFSPKTIISKSQFVTAMIRMFEGKRLDENYSPRWSKYFEKARDMGIVSAADLVTFENNITRYEAALFLYRFKVKYQMLQNINSDKIQNEIISTVPGSITTGVNNLKLGNVYVDMNLLQNGNFEIGYVEIFGKRHKVVRTMTDKYFANNFVRYGDLFDLDTEQKIGTTSFIVSNGYVIEGAIRLTSETYQILQLKDTKAYYQIKQIQ